MLREVVTMGVIVVLAIIAWPVYLVMVIGSRRAVRDIYGA
jgi:hypothetical protein